MGKSFIFFIAVSALFFSCQERTPVVEWIHSSPAGLWQDDKIGFVENSESEPSVEIFPNQVEQTIDGFGGCFNELGWEALQIVDSASRAQILTDIFDPLTGCKFNICRMPIGANDYAVDWYSHNENPDDFDMSDFNIQRDKKRLVPYIKWAQNISPDLKIWGSPWCPPAWMKDNNHYACRPDSSVNDLSPEGAGQEMKTQFIMKEEYLSAYALYFSKFLSAYKDEGIDLYAIHPQNELNSCQNFPSCIWKPSDMATFIGDYLGPKIEEDHPGVDIYLGTIERPHIERVDTILTHTEASKYIKGVGFQWGGKGAIPKVNKKYPEMNLVQTETECGDGSNDWDAAAHTFGLMSHYFNNGANSYMYWNLVLDETGKSQWGWKQNSMVTINSATREITYNPEFYLMKHLSYFVEPGATKIASSEENCLAFKNDESIVFVYFNQGAKREATFAVAGATFKAELPAQSFSTFKVYLN